jgi:hypothetical protein
MSTPASASPSTRARRSTPLADLLAQLALWAVAAGVVFLLMDALGPPQHLPWTPLRLDDPRARPRA